jgi:hypothetical protein
MGIEIDPFKEFDPEEDRRLCADEAFFPEVA